MKLTILMGVIGALVVAPFCGEHPPSYVGRLVSRGCEAQWHERHVLIQLGEISRTSIKLDTGPLCGVVRVERKDAGWIISPQTCISVGEAWIRSSTVSGTFKLTRADGGVGADAATVQLMLRADDCTEHLTGTLIHWQR